MYVHIEDAISCYALIPSRRVTIGSEGDKRGVSHVARRSRLVRLCLVWAYLSFLHPAEAVEIVRMALPRSIEVGHSDCYAPYDIADEATRIRSSSCLVYRSGTSCVEGSILAQHSRISASLLNCALSSHCPD